MNCAGNGFSVGNLATVTISGTVPYRNNSTARNSPIELYVIPPGEQSRTLIYEWFIKDCTIYDNSSINFTGVDVMAFASNDYSINIVGEKGKWPVVEYDTIGRQFETAESTLAALSGVSSVTITRCSSGVVNSSNQGNFQTSGSIKSLLEAAAKFDAANYYTSYRVEQGVILATLQKITSSETIITECAPLTISGNNPTINRVTVASSDSTDIAYDFHGQQQATAAGTMTVITPFIRLKNSAGNDVLIRPTNCESLAGGQFGEIFNCAKVYVGIYEFLTPMTWMLFPEVETHRFCLNHAQYQLTTMGIYASVSGGSRNISDYEYVGTTEQRIRNKINFDQPYRELVVSRDGLYLTPTIPQRNNA